MSLHPVPKQDLPATCADWQAVCHLEEEATAQGLKKMWTHGLHINGRAFSPHFKTDRS